MLGGFHAASLTSAGLTWPASGTEAVATTTREVTDVRARRSIRGWRQQAADGAEQRAHGLGRDESARGHQARNGARRRRGPEAPLHLVLRLTRGGRGGRGSLRVDGRRDPEGHPRHSHLGRHLRDLARPGDLEELPLDEAVERRMLDRLPDEERDHTRALASL